MAASPADDDVPRLVEECLRLREDQGSHAVEKFLEGHPAHRDTVRQRLRTLARVGFLDDGAENAGDVPERLGEFRLLERIGGGGMGVVFLAEQEPIGRRVALKLIRPQDRLFARSRERFRREVEAVARLDHPGIVPIYTFGEEGGVPYYAMEYVVGRGLDAVLDAVRARAPSKLTGRDLAAVLPSGTDSESSRSDVFEGSWVDACFRIVGQVALALDHAHRRGVLHRDVKPSNIMLGADGRARLLDFGLARAEESPGITASGSLLGSLPYMAPEQVRGEPAAIGTHTDVYALGVTLYELLTLHPPYQAETAERLRERILEGLPARIALRNSSVPWDAETVCRKAMAPEPAHRYGSMAEFAEDIGRFLNREPIRARRSSALLRARRWAQRRPAAAIALAFTLLIAAAVPLVWAVQARAAQRAEDNLDDAIAAADAMLADGSDPTFAAQPGSDPARQRLLERALQLYQRLLERERGREEVARGVVHAQVRLGEILGELGRWAEAERALRTALDDPAGAGEHRARAKLALLRTLAAAQQHGKARECAEELIEELQDSPGADASARLLAGQRLAVVWQTLAWVHNKSGRAEPTLAAAQRCVELLEELDRQHPGRTDVPVLLGSARQDLAYFTGYYRPDVPYEPIFAQAVATLRPLAESSTDPAPRATFARALLNWAQVDMWRERWRPAIDRAREAVALFDALVDDHPQRFHFVDNLLRAAHTLAWLVDRAGDRSAALAQFDAALARARTLLEVWPDTASLITRVAMLESELAFRLGEARRFAETEPHWQRSLQMWERLAGHEGSRLDYLGGTGTLLDKWARSEYYRGAAGRARAYELAGAACARHRQAIAESPDGPLHRRRLARTTTLMAALLERGGRHGDAVALLAETAREADFEGWQGVARTLGPRLGQRADFRALLPPEVLRSWRPRERFFRIVP
jgi:serine/threonine protein kinase